MKVKTAYQGRGTQKGYNFTLLERRECGEGDSCSCQCLYSKENGGEPCYEVVKVRKRKKDRYAWGRQIAKKGDEYLPSPEEWGMYGWSYMTLEEAKEKLNELVK